MEKTTRESTLQERFDKWMSSDEYSIIPFIESEIALARAEGEKIGEERMRQKCLKVIPDFKWTEMDTFEANEMWEGITNEIRDSILQL